VGDTRFHVLKTDGNLYSSGDNQNGELGLGIVQSSTSSVSLTDVKFAADQIWGIHSAAVKNDGTLWFTGNSEQFVFGDSTTPNVNVWTQSDLQGDITGSGRTVISASTSGYFTALLMNDNTLWMAGCAMDWCNNYAVQIDTNVRNIAAGSDHLLYVKNDDTLWGIGDNGVGQLGNSAETYYHYDTPYEIDTNVKLVASAMNASYYIKNDNTLWGMGSNMGAQLGTGNYDDQYSPVQIDTNVKYVGGDDWSTVYLKNDNTLWGVGSSYLGLNPTGSPHLTPVKMDENVSAMKISRTNVYYKKTNNLLYGWGQNDAKSLGSSIYRCAMYSTNATSGWTSDGVTDLEYLGSGNKVRWNHSIYGNDKFVAVGAGSVMSPSDAIYSYDGMLWHTASFEHTTETLSGVTYGNGKFVATAYIENFNFFERAETLISSDGITWSTSSLKGEFNGTYFAASQLNSVIYTGSQFVAVGNKVWTSPDGETWTLRNNAPDFTYVMTAITYGDGKYVACAQEKGQYSTDGINWYSCLMPTASYNDITFGDGKFVAVANSTASYSTDGINWTTSYYTGSMLKVIYDGTKFVGCGPETEIEFGIASSIYTSTDGISWTQHYTGNANNWGTISYNDGKYILLSKTLRNSVAVPTRLTV
jgi:alpha-tubulin suppressor-like RCC1 family protein